MQLATPPILFVKWRKCAGVAEFGHCTTLLLIVSTSRYEVYDRMRANILVISH